MHCICLKKSKWPITEIGCPKSKTEIYALNLLRLHVSPHVTKVILAFNAHVNGNLICSDFSCLASDQAECQASWASSLLLPSCTKVATGGILPTSHVLSLFAEKHRCILSTCRPSYKEMQSGGTAWSRCMEDVSSSSVQFTRYIYVSISRMYVIQIDPPLPETGCTPPKVYLPTGTTSILEHDAWY